MFGNVFQDQNVVVFGHRGFKGSWLVAWLNTLGANVFGYGLETGSSPNHFALLGTDICKMESIGDIRDLGAVSAFIKKTKPRFVFHLAAQAFVQRSLDDPLDTWTTNVNGTVNILEALKQVNWECSAVLITSDKVYENVEWVWGYRENDRLGGKDPYSASKACAELAIASHVRCFFDDNSGVKIVSARAGNVIGGGDWGENRIVPDCVKRWAINKGVTIRNPSATRPWQHVLEPLSGYMRLAQVLQSRSDLQGESFNFGPPTEQDMKVSELVAALGECWGVSSWDIAKNASTKEATLLRLNCEKATSILEWRPVLDIAQTLEFTMSWYKNYYETKTLMRNFSEWQIQTYTEKATRKKLSWVN